MGEHFADGILLNQFTVADDRHAVADAFHHIHLVRNKEDRQAEATVNVFQQFQNRTRGSRIQCAGRFITQQYLRIASQCAGNRHTLLLTTRQICRVAVMFVTQTHEVEQFGNATLHFFFRCVVQLQRQGDVAENGAGSQQVEVLEDHANLTTRFGEFFL